MNIFQRLAHKLFGWHFIAYRWGFGEVAVRRVRRMPNGRLYIIFLFDPVFLDERGERFEPLTWTDEASA